MNALVGSLGADVQVHAYASEEQLLDGLVDIVQVSPSPPPCPQTHPYAHPSTIAASSLCFSWPANMLLPVRSAPAEQLTLACIATPYLAPGACTAGALGASACSQLEGQHRQLALLHGAKTPKP